MNRFVFRVSVWFWLMVCLAFSVGGCSGTTSLSQDQSQRFSFMCKCCLIPMSVQSLDEICDVCKCGGKAGDCKTNEC